MAFKDRFGKLKSLRRISTANFHLSGRSNDYTPRPSSSSASSMQVLIGKPYELSADSGKRPTMLPLHVEKCLPPIPIQSPEHYHVPVVFTPTVRAEHEALRIYIHQITPQLEFLTQQVYLFSQYLNTVSTGLGILARHSRNEVKQLLMLPQKPPTPGSPPGGTTRDWLHDFELRVPLYEANAWQKAVHNETTAFTAASVDIMSRLGDRLDGIDMSVRAAEGKLRSMAVVAERLRADAEVSRNSGHGQGGRQLTGRDMYLFQGQAKADAEEEETFHKHVGAYVRRLRKELETLRGGLEVLTGKYSIGNAARQGILSCEGLANLEVPISWPTRFELP